MAMTRASPLVTGLAVGAPAVLARVNVLVADWPPAAAEAEFTPTRVPLMSSVATPEVLV